MDENSEKGTETNGSKPWPNLPTRFTSERQPDSENRRKGWLKKKRNRELIKAILDMQYVGDLEMRAKVAQYYGIEDPAEITNEVMALFMQMTKAINKNDLGALDMLMNRAYGAPLKSEPEVERDEHSAITGMNFEVVKEPEKPNTSDGETTNGQITPAK